MDESLRAHRRAKWLAYKKAEEEKEKASQIPDVGKKTSNPDLLGSNIPNIPNITTFEADYVAEGSDVSSFSGASLNSITNSITNSNASLRSLDGSTNFRNSPNVMGDKQPKEKAGSRKRAYHDISNPTPDGGTLTRCMKMRDPIDFHPTYERDVELNVLSWNLDCLDERDLIARVYGFMDQIRRLHPTVVLLQEVNDVVMGMIKHNLSKVYNFVTPFDEDTALRILNFEEDPFDAGGALKLGVTILDNESGLGTDGKKYMTTSPTKRYYNAILLSNYHYFIESKTCYMFPNTLMGRHVLTVECSTNARDAVMRKGKILDPIHFIFASTHLESEKQSSETRIEQLALTTELLSQTYNEVISTTEKEMREKIGGVEYYINPQKALQNSKYAHYKPIVVFGGDLNIREKEIKSLSRYDSKTSSFLVSQNDVSGSQNVQKKSQKCEIIFKFKEAALAQMVKLGKLGGIKGVSTTSHPPQKDPTMSQNDLWDNILNPEMSQNGSLDPFPFPKSGGVGGVDGDVDPDGPTFATPNRLSTLSPSPFVPPPPNVSEPLLLTDLWALAGSPAKAKNTWDLRRNHETVDGEEVPGFCVARFDRLFCNSAKKADFSLIGQSKARESHLCVSDHLGLFCKLEF